MVIHCCKSHSLDSSTFLAVKVMSIAVSKEKKKLCIFFNHMDTNKRSLKLSRRNLFVIP